jgi:putative oxidoreductase
MASEPIREPVRHHLLTPKYSAFVTTPSDATESKLVSLFDWAEVIGRIGLALLFLWSGYEKLAHPSSTVALMQTYGLPAADLLIWPAAFLELVGGAVLVLGWKARWVALALAAYTVAATFIFHAYWSVPADQVMNQEIHFMSNLAIAGGLLLVFANGAGGYAPQRS